MQWKYKDKVWLAARQESWLPIQQCLVLSGRYTQKELKIFEDYYLKGKEPKWDRQWGDDPIPLIYRLWFDPSQSLENWQSIMDEVLAYPDPTQIEPILRETYDVLWEGNNITTYSGRSGAPDGFMGGLEEKFFNFLMGAPEAGDFIFYRGGQFYKRLIFNDGYYWGMAEWLNLKRLQNSYKINRYSLEYWYCRLSDEQMQALQESEGGIKHLLQYLRAVASYPEPDSSNADFVRQDYCRKVRDILNNRPLPELMQQLWEKTKV
jgi:hypothetical protein